MPGASPPLVNTAIRFIPPALPVPTLKSGPFEALPLRAVLYRAQASAWEQRVAAWSRRALPHEPSPREPRPAQPPIGVRIRHHGAPHQSGAVVLDQGDDRSLVYPLVIDVEPAGRAALGEGRIEGIAEAVGGEQAGAVGLAHGPERGDGDLGRERDRATRRGGREGAIIGRLGERRPARPVAVELALAAAERERHVARAIRGGEPPDPTAVAGPAARVRRGVRLLGVGGRSEERRVGKEWKTRWARVQQKTAET